MSNVRRKFYVFQGQRSGVYEDYVSRSSHIRQQLYDNTTVESVFVEVIYSRDYRGAAHQPAYEVRPFA